MKIRNRPEGQRRALVNTTIEADLISELWLASDRLLREPPPGEHDSKLEIQLYVTRVLMARLIVGGIQGASDRTALKDAALQLHELSNHAREARSRHGGKTGRREALAESKSQRDQLVAHVKREAGRLRQECPHLKSQSDLANTLVKRFQKQEIFREQGWLCWKSFGALIEFTRRNSFKL